MGERAKCPRFVKAVIFYLTLEGRFEGELVCRHAGNSFKRISNPTVQNVGVNMRFVRSKSARNAFIKGALCSSEEGISIRRQTN